MTENTLTITLPNPVKVEGNGTIAELKLRELTNKEVREAEEEREAAGTTPAAFRVQQVAMVAASSGLAKDMVKELPISILDQAGIFLAGLNNGGTARMANPPASYTIDLDPPLEAAGITFANMLLVEPTCGQVLAAESAFNTGTDLSVSRRFKAILAARVSRIPFDAVDSLPVSIVNRAASYLVGFTSAGPATGAS